MNTTLQVPIDPGLKSRATRAAKNMGFSSLQETVRIFLTKLANGTMRVSLEPTNIDEHVSSKALARYDKMERDIKSGKEPVYKAKNAQDLLDQLYGRKPLVHAKVP